MKKKVWIAALSILIILLLGAFIWLIYFTGYDYSMADEVELSVNDCAVAAGADGSGTVEAVKDGSLEIDGATLLNDEICNVDFSNVTINYIA